MTTDFEQLVSRLSQAKVEFVAIGGWAAIIHGAATVTYDVMFATAARQVTLSECVNRLQAYIPRCEVRQKTYPSS